MSSALPSEPDEVGGEMAPIWATLMISTLSPADLIVGAFGSGEVSVYR